MQIYRTVFKKSVFLSWYVFWPHPVDGVHSIEVRCKLMPAATAGHRRSPSICFALCDPVTLTIDILT